MRWADAVSASRTAALPADGDRLLLAILPRAGAAGLYGVGGAVAAWEAGSGPLLVHRMTDTGAAPDMAVAVADILSRGLSLGPAPILLAVSFCALPVLYRLVARDTSPVAAALLCANPAVMSLALAGMGWAAVGIALTSRGLGGLRPGTPHRAIPCLGLALAVLYLTAPAAPAAVLLALGLVPACLPAAARGPRRLLATVIVAAAPAVLLSVGLFYLSLVTGTEAPLLVPALPGWREAALAALFIGVAHGVPPNYRSQTAVVGFAVAAGSVIAT